MTTLNVNEIFGLTVQGEGPSIGQPCAFVRLFQCNLQCTWCDTPYTWAVTEQKAKRHRDGLLYSKDEQSIQMYPDQIAGMLERMPWPWARLPLVVISGGEPMLQQAGIVELIQNPYLRQRGVHWEIETAGTIAPTAELAALVNTELVRFNVSPKLVTSGNSFHARRKWPVLQQLASYRDTAFKFVVTREDAMDELGEIEEIVVRAGIRPQNVYLMPEGTTASHVLVGMHHLVDEAIKRGYNLTTRMHTLIWGDERGR
jgi:7-carboxy-7-deazaguanine synthase